MTIHYPARDDRDPRDPVLHAFQAVVFDLDGVITDTAAIHAQAWKSTMDRVLSATNDHAAPFDPVRDYREYIDGRPRLEGAATFLESRGIWLEEGTPDDAPGLTTLWAVATHKNTMFRRELDQRGVRVFPDAKQLLEHLANDGVPCAVVTASENGLNVLSRAGLADRFAVTVTGLEARQWQLAGKPAPDTFLRAAELLGARPSACVVIEDAGAGVQAGRAGGFGLVVGIDRVENGDLLARSGADVVLTDLAALTDMDANGLSAWPGRSLDAVFEAILICPDSGSPDGSHLDAVVEQVRATGTVVAVAKSDPAQALHELIELGSREGIAPGLVLAIGWLDALDLSDEARSATIISVDDHPPGRHHGQSTIRWLGGGWPALEAVLGDQATRRRTRRTPTAPGDPRWSIVIHGDDERPPRTQHSLLTVADTRFGTRGTREEEAATVVAGVLAGGIYDESTEPALLLEGPGWTRLRVSTSLDADEDVRTLDLRTGVLYRVQPALPIPLRTARFASLARPGVQAMRAEGAVAWLHHGPALTQPVADGTFSRRQSGSRTSGLSSSDSGGGIAAAAVHHEALAEGGPQPVRVVERLVALTARPLGVPRSNGPEQLLDEVVELGFDGLLAEQRRAWARRWDDAEIAIESDPENELAVRFALFHLMAAAPISGEAAIGPRGLSGPTYRGHVFWDTDVFVLPFLAATCPPAAHAMLRYRTRRLPAARRAAAAQGRQGARFPWESARTGADVTPRQYVTPEGEVVPILTGQYEEHITADVAWAAQQLVDWSGRRDLLSGPLGWLVLESARYWASRVRLDADGHGHIDSVMGPDEYHEHVDDNAYTNVMARWNLRAGAGLADGGRGTAAEEAQRWREVADSLVDGFDPETSVYEQFAGYRELEPLTVAEIAEPPVAVDLLLGRERIARSQIIKQPDVLMLHHLVPSEVAHGSLRPNLDFYLPRCAHGSSLSPAIHAALLARDGRPDDAMALFEMSCRLDLADLTGTTAGGLHMATFGGVWQAVVGGFAGIRPMGERLLVDPQLPSRWSALKVRVRYRGVRTSVTVRHDEIQVKAEGRVDVSVPGSEDVRVGPNGHVWRRKNERWRAS